MVKSVHVNSGKTVSETLSDLRQVFEDWGIERSEWQAQPLRPSEGYEVKYWLPYESKPHVVACWTQPRQAENLRAVFMFVQDQQRAALRGVAARLGDIEYMRLLPGSVADGPIPQGVRATRPQAKGTFKTLAAAASYLGLSVEAPQEVVDMVARGLMAKHHPEGQHPDTERFKKVQEAKEFIYNRREWNAP